MEISELSARRVDSRNRLLIDRVLDRVEAEKKTSIDLTGSTVDQAVFDAQALKSASNKMMSTMGKEALQYATSHDYMPLKAEIAERYGLCGLKVEDSNFTVTNGSTQAVDLICKVLVDDGDTVLVEKPLHWRFLQAISMYDAKVLEVPALSDGPDLEVLEKQLETGRPQVYFATPTAQEPGGAVWSMEKRTAVAQLMKEYDCMFIELDRSGELMEPGKRPMYMKRLLGDQCILVGSFSPSLGPGLRIGWVCTTDKELSGYFNDGKQKTDTHANGYIQRVLWEYLKDADYAGHASRVCEVYDAKRATVMKLLDETGLRSHLALNHQAGTTLWLKLGADKTGAKVFEAAADAGVLVVPGEMYSLVGDTSGYIALDYAGASEAQLRKAFAVLKQVMM